MNIPIDHELKDIVICALRYAIGRKTYITGEICEYIIKHPELIDKRVKEVMLRGLGDINNYYDENDNIDRPQFILLKIFLENWEVDE